MSFPMPVNGFNLYGMTPVEYTKHLLKQMGMTSCSVTGETTLDPNDPIIRLDEWIEIYWSEDGLTEKTIVGEKKFPGFYYGHVTHEPATRWEPENYDFVQVGETRYLTSAIRWAILKWVEHTINQINEFFSERDYAYELSQQKGEN